MSRRTYVRYNENMDNSFGGMREGYDSRSSLEERTAAAPGIPEEEQKRIREEIEALSKNKKELLGLTGSVGISIHGRTRRLPAVMRLFDMGDTARTRFAMRTLFEVLNKEFFGGRKHMQNLFNSPLDEDDSTDMLWRAMLRLYGVSDEDRIGIFKDQSSNFEARLSDEFGELSDEFQKIREAHGWKKGMKENVPTEIEHAEA